MKNENMTLPILDELAREILTVTEEEMTRTLRRLKPVKRGEKKLGIIHDPAARRLFCLSTRYRKLEDAANHRRTFDAETQEDEDMANEEAARRHSLHEVATALFWHQCREDIGGSAWSADSVAIREGFMMVIQPQGGGKSNPIAGLLGMLGRGGFSISGLPPGMEPDTDDDES